MKLKIVMLIALTGLIGGCTATITPRAEIYTEARLPAVVVERHPRPIIVSRPHQPVHQTIGPIVSGRRYYSARHVPLHPGHPPKGHRR